MKKYHSCVIYLGKDEHKKALTALTTDLRSIGVSVILESSLEEVVDLLRDPESHNKAFISAVGSELESKCGPKDLIISLDLTESREKLLDEVSDAMRVNIGHRGDRYPRCIGCEGQVFNRITEEEGIKRLNFPAGELASLYMFFECRGCDKVYIEGGLFIQSQLRGFNLEVNEDWE